MPDYEAAKRDAHKALTSGKIDINFYHLICEQIDNAVKSMQVQSTYIDAKTCKINVK